VSRSAQGGGVYHRILCGGRWLFGFAKQLGSCVGNSRLVRRDVDGGASGD
jgi:hypothetical protein